MRAALSVTLLLTLGIGLVIGLGGMPLRTQGWREAAASLLAPAPALPPAPPAPVAVTVATAQTGEVPGAPAPRATPG